MSSYYGGLISDGTRTVQENRIIATTDYYNYGVTVNAKVVYANKFQQAYYFTDGIHACVRLMSGPGITIVTGSVNYCQSLLYEDASYGCPRAGTVNRTYQQNCIPTCSDSTPNWNAEYGICE